MSRATVPSVVCILFSLVILLSVPVGVAAAQGPGSANYQIRASVLNQGGSPSGDQVCRSPSFELVPASLGEAVVGSTDGDSYRVSVGFSSTARPPAGDAIFADGFDSGDLSAWSAVAP